MTQMTHAEALEQAKRIVAQMTLDEKIGQLNYTAPAIERLGIPEYNYWNEALHGVARAGVATVFPQAIGMAAMFDDAGLKRVAEVIAEEGRAKYNEYSAHGDRDIYKGLTYWSPNVNIFRDPRWGRGQETYGEDPYLTSRLGVAFIRGLQGDGRYLKLAATAKHFAVHSGPEAKRHEFDAVASKKDMAETYLPAFKAAVEEADVECVMTAYNSTNGQPCSVNDDLLKNHLYGQWSFEGHVVSDFMALEDVHENHHYTKDAAETMADAIRAGLDLCAGHCSGATKEAIERGLVSEDEVTRAVEALYATRVRLGMFADDCEYDQIDYAANDSAAHRAFNRSLAPKTFVLLKNDGILPLDKSKLDAISVTGPNADSVQAILGNYFGRPSHKSTILEGIERACGDDVRVYSGLGCSLFGIHAESGLSRENERESEAVINAEHSDVIIAVLGLDATIEGEQGDAGNSMGAGDKANLSLPGRQRHLLERLLEVGKPVIVLLAAGSALSLDGLEDHPNLAALMQVWYPGGQGGDAVADVLFGKAAPSGKLPVTFYRNCDGMPDFEDYSMKGRTYRYLEDEALYPFGYGLTYSTTALGDMNVDVDRERRTANVSLTLENTGGRDEREIVQVYVKNLDSTLAPRNWQLAGFQPVDLAAGANATVTVPVDPDAFTVYDEDGKQIVDGNRFAIYAGVSQPDARSAQLLGFAPESTTIEF
ncbi:MULTISPECIES: glycoside hydrolase family 3 C-terminal domain-containing protein [Bifidobacterium]|uniref:glycoside hydrolase family 3 C-terminal domain-containing protein n=1 Tax=Bifidobacterium TaxID=1678 RepID=UPI001BDBD040|nr:MULTISPECIES: glycoside hydrolase family 3 C-terminal domain-containing protein [Bifidobacterium]MBT1162028.1 glycoside hydrolase family 3 C-terminal domain-containing protein [Bifidobacterium sp. SO1]MBW3078057.1 glycoside hydrolase family 3 C-terminal domain-containing protein [Bifidobacterium simiiventris]